MTDVREREAPERETLAMREREATTVPSPSAAVIGARQGVWWVVTTVLAVVGLVVGVLAFALRASESTPASGAAAVAATGAPLVVDVVLGDLFVEPSTVEVAAGRPLELRVTNEGAMPHDLAVGGTAGTPLLDPGASATLEVGALSASAQAWCTVPGHRAAGMVMDIVVVGAEPATAAAAGTAEDAGATAANIDVAAEPAAGWEPRDAAAPATPSSPAGTVHEIELRAAETVIEVAPGVTQEMWTFGGTVPGPILRGKVGDTFEVTLVNDGVMGHSIDFHASKVAWNDEMRTIQPGESLVYSFTADHAGVFMYHCGTAPALHHIGNGMFGAIIVDPPNLPPVDHEVVLVQSELYTGPEGEPGDLTKMVEDDWDAVVFNGYVNQYAHAPIRVEPGERVRAFVLDAGPSENSSFHIVGTIFDTVYKEGAYTLQPDAGRGGAQALDLQPAQGGFVEFTFAEAGLYPIVTHKFSNVGRGALGLFQAGEVEMPEGAAH